MEFKSNRLTQLMLQAECILIYQHVYPIRNQSTSLRRGKKIPTFHDPLILHPFYRKPGDADMGTDSQYDTLAEFQAASPPAILKRVSANLARDFRNFKRITTGSTSRPDHVMTADSA